MKRKILGVFISIIFTLLLLELVIRIFDPLGVVYFNDVAAMWKVRIDDPSGYSYPEGSFDMGRYRFSTNADGSRVTPDADPNGPHVTFIGDSQTFAYGVDDADVWVNLVARELGLDAVNVGRSAYNIGNFALQIENIEGCVVWLTISNDPDVTVRYTSRHIEPITSYTVRTLEIAMIKVLFGRFTGYGVGKIDETDAQMYEALTSRPDLLTLAFDDGNYGDIMRDEYGAVLIPSYTKQNSAADPHANIEGNREIAAGAAPVIAEWLKGRDCR